MIPIEVSLLSSGRAPTLAAGVSECLETLRSRLLGSGRDGGDVLSLTFFADPAHAGRWRAATDRILSAVARAFEGIPPPASVVAQAPEGPGTVAIEAVLLPAGAREFTVERKIVAGHPVTIAAGAGLRQVHGGNFSSAPGKRGIAAQAEDAFRQMEAVLGAMELSFGNVVRQWNYVAGVLDVRSSGPANRQGYQALNDVRTEFYDRCEFPAGYPAATGIGQAAGGVLLEFIALSAAPDVAVVPVSNPRQVDAWQYSPDVLVGAPVRARVGKTAPKFERGKLVARAGAEVLFVSGTAAVIGEKSVAQGDVKAQTRTTIENIASLGRGKRLTHLRGYVKRAADIPAVRRVCRAELGPIPALFVQADVCRNELLVELEGALVCRPKGSGSGT